MYLGFFAWKICLWSPIVFLLDHVCISVWTAQLWPLLTLSDGFCDPFTYSALEFIWFCVCACVCVSVICFFEQFFTSWSSPNPRISHFYEEPQFLLLVNGIRNQEVGASFVHCYQDIVASGPCQLTKQRNTRVHISQYPAYNERKW